MTSGLRLETHTGLRLETQTTISRPQRSKSTVRYVNANAACLEPVTLGAALSPPFLVISTDWIEEHQSLLSRFDHPWTRATRRASNIRPVPDRRALGVGNDNGGEVGNAGPHSN